jgi:CubicO group peptidase (beta-lactamase class C family)
MLKFSHFGGHPTPRAGLRVGIALVIVGCGTTAGTGQSAADGLPAGWAARIDSLLAPAVEAGALSAVLLVGRGDEVLFDRSVGDASRELGVPNDTSTVFGLASLTKAMTAIIVDALVREGALDLAAPVDAYIEGFPAGPEGGRPTIGHLLAHRAGVPHRVTDAADEAFPLSAADIVERVIDAGLRFEPGTERLYSSAGYTCLARIVELVEGRPWAAVLEARVLGPAGMAASSTETGERLLPGRAVPHRLGASEGRVAIKGVPPKDLRFLTGAGDVFATAGDVFRLARAVENGAFGAGVRRRFRGSDADGWQATEGRTNGYNAFLDLHPARGLTFVFLSNLQSAANWQLRAAIHAVLTGEPPRPIQLPPPVAAGFEPPSEIVGLYDGGGAPIEIAVRDGGLFRADNEFYPVDGDRYYIPGSGSAMRFRRDASGVVDALVTLREGGDSVYPRIRP